jgi:hypothetical protein
MDSFSEIGKIQGSIGLIIAVIITVILLIAATYLLLKPESFQKVLATVTSVNCPSTLKATTSGKSNIITYDCVLNVQYVINQISYKSSLIINSQTDYSNTKTIEILYNPQNPTEIKHESISSKSLASISSVIGIVIMFFAGLQYYLTHKYQSYAALTGVGTSASILSSAISRS